MCAALHIQRFGAGLYRLQDNPRVQLPNTCGAGIPPLQQIFENELLDYISNNTKLQTVDGRSDLVLEGEITQYYLTPQAVTEDAYASKTRLTIGVRIKYTDNKAENKDIDQSFTAYRDFDSSQMLTDVQEELCRRSARNSCSSYSTQH